MPGMSFSLWTCRASYVTRAPLRFPVHAGNAFRGALGFRLEEEVFRPRAETGPSGLKDRPRPFVLRASHLDGMELPAATPFEVGFNVFAEPAADILRHALSQFGRGSRLLAALEFTGWAVEAVHLDLSPRSSPERVRLRIRTPLELKGWDGAGLPPFAVLAARLRDRLSALGAFYGGGAPALDYVGLAERSAEVRAVAGDVEARRVERRSTRTGQRHSLGGVTGWAEYRGGMDEFVPLIEAGYWTGVGRHTVWGQGWIEMVEPGAPSMEISAAPGT